MAVANLSKKPEQLSHVDQCYGILRNLIVKCEIAPGARLTEKDLMARLGFGRTPVREALLRLNQDGIVDTKPRSGYRVRPLTYKSVDDFFVVWRAIAPLIAQLAFRNMTNRDRIVLTELSHSGTKIPHVEVDAFQGISSKFFRELARLADSEPLLFIFNRFGAEMDRIFGIFLPTERGQQWTQHIGKLEQWTPTLSPEGAGDLIRTAIDQAHEALLAYIEEDLAAGKSVFSKELGAVSTKTVKAPAQRKPGGRGAGKLPVRSGR